MLKAIGSDARRDIESFLGQSVNLQLWIKIRPDWRESSRDLKDLGYRE
jgi:GTP-binding protein Era